MDHWKQGSCQKLLPAEVTFKHSVRMDCTCATDREQKGEGERVRKRQKDSLFFWGTECVSVQQRERDNLQAVHTVSWGASWCKSMSCIQRGKHSVRCVSANIQQINNKGSHLNGPIREIPFPTVLLKVICVTGLQVKSTSSSGSRLSRPFVRSRRALDTHRRVLVPALWNHLIAKKQNKKEPQRISFIGRRVGGCKQPNRRNPFPLLVLFAL